MLPPLTYSGNLPSAKCGRPHMQGRSVESERLEDATCGRAASLEIFIKPNLSSTRFHSDVVLMRRKRSRVRCKRLHAKGL